jgi:hypothetical protein
MLKKDVRSLHRLATPPPKAECKDSLTAFASDEESETIRRTNAYPGATNDIGSVHQRKWYLSLDRHSSGFTPIRDNATASKQWVRRRDANGIFRGFDKFCVLGRDVQADWRATSFTTRALKATFLGGCGGRSPNQQSRYQVPWRSQFLLGLVFGREISRYHCLDKESPVLFGSNTQSHCPAQQSLPIDEPIAETPPNEPARRGRAGPHSFI